MSIGKIALHQKCEIADGLVPAYARLCCKQISGFAELTVSDGTNSCSLTFLCKTQA
jgi:hypothetical protein